MKITFGNWWKKNNKKMKSIIPFSIVIIWYPEKVFNISIMNFSLNINFSVVTNQ